MAKYKIDEITIQLRSTNTSNHPEYNSATLVANEVTEYRLESELLILRKFD